MTDKILSGKKISELVLNNLAHKIKKNSEQHNIKPCLAVILIGDDPASHVYVGHKIKACEKVGFKSKSYQFKKDTPEKDILSLINKLNNQKDTHGILLQLPLPKHLNTQKIINYIKAEKDVDGLTIQNQGSLALNDAKHIPCTPKGIMTLLKAYDILIEGKISCVIGRSILVGSPMVKLLNQANSTVINIHSKSQNPQSLSQQADILICAAGVPLLIDETWVKEGSTVIDVGIHRKNNKLCGDVNFEKVIDKVRYISPVPGGVGPMTICSLLENCYDSFIKY